MAENCIVVVGAGVAGLTTALLLSKNTEYKVTVAAKHMPGDYDVEYASPWAGANFLPVSVDGTDAAEWESNTWPELERLARCHPEAGVHFQEAVLYNRAKDLEGGKGTALAASTVSDPWYKELVPNFRRLPKDQVPLAFDNGNAFTSVCINTAVYLPWLTSRCLEAGVLFKRAVFGHISEAAKVHHSGRRADAVVNCTGLSARTLGGVEDVNMIPARGQTVLVRNEASAMYASSGCDDGDDEVVYLMQRAAGGGTLLGGCYQKGNFDSQVDPNLATRIMKRCIDICPSLTDGKGIEHLSIIRHSVGLRPVRVGGTRLESENIGGINVIHNYGHQHMPFDKKLLTPNPDLSGGYGYQASYGCSKVAVQLVDEALTPRPRL